MRYWWIVVIVVFVSCGELKPLQRSSASSDPDTSQPTPQMASTPGNSAGPANPTSAPLQAPGFVLADRIDPQLPKQTNEERWRQQQVQREVFEPRRIYLARQPVELLWLDPATGQSLVIGRLSGEFTAQAQFLFRPTAAQALEVPYRINNDFGLTAISPAVQERMAAAGYTESVEAYTLYIEPIELLREE